MLVYVGDGSAVVGIPARDLDDAEVKKYGGIRKLVATGLYVKGDSDSEEESANDEEEEEE